MDSSDGEWAWGLPTACGSEPGVWPIPPGPGLPEGLEILAFGRNWLEGGAMTFYRHAGGGFVFSVGSLTFEDSLVVDERIQTIVRNAIAEGGCGSPVPRPRFRRGDCNTDDSVDISVAGCVLEWLFLAGDVPGCRAATNVNGDGLTDISDAVSLLAYLFLGGAPPANPFEVCGPGELPEDATLGCNPPPAECQ